MCVDNGTTPNAIDGKWSEYSEWSTCTRTCGGGVQYRERSCDSPTPQFGGLHCTGEDKEYKMCNTEVRFISLPVPSQYFQRV